MDHDDLDGFEDLTTLDGDIGDSSTGPAGTPASGRVGRAATRLGVSVPTAVAGALLVGAIAFGASLGAAGRHSDGSPASPPAERAVLVEPTTPPTDGPRLEPTRAPESKTTPEPAVKPIDGLETEPTRPTEESKPTAEPTRKAEPTAKPTPKPTPKPEPTAKPKPEPTERPVLELALAVREGAVLIKWSPCAVDGADYYKVVRSSDPTVKWPAGENDKVVSVVEIGAATKAWDEGAPAGKKAWYRVFCVNHTDAGWKVVAASGTGAIVAPDPKPEPTPKPVPEPQALWIEAGVDGSAIVLHWERCDSDGFSHYRIVRKAGGEGAVIAELGEPGETTYIDSAVDVGVAYHYVVQAKGQVEGDWVLLGTTEWVSVTVE